MERRYIHYSGYGGASTTLANPLSLMADGSGGGVVSYGLSTMISYDHVVQNSTLSSLFQQTIASRNILNLWGYSPKKHAVSDTRIGLSQWDEIDIIGSEGWMNRGWYGDADTIDTFIAGSLDDEDGADWYSGSDYNTTGDTVLSFDDTLQIRQPTQEMASWDNIHNPLFDEVIVRYPQIQARWIEFDINATDIDLAEGPYYVEARLVLDGTSVWKNVSIDSSSDLTIRFDLYDLLDEYDYSSYDGWSGSRYKSEAEAIARDKGKSHSMIFDGSSSDGAANTPLLVTAIYKDNPADVPQGDIVAMMENLVYYDYDFLRMSIDHQYAHDYEQKWAELENNHARMKPVMIMVGIGMFALGLAESGTGVGALAGVPTMMFGADMIVGNVWGWSPLDNLLKTGLAGATALAGQNTSFIFQEGFSFFQFTGNHFIDLLLTQATFMAVGGVLSGFKGAKNLLRRMTAKDFVSSGMESGVKGLGTADAAIGRFLSKSMSELFDHLAKHGKTTEFLTHYIIEQLVHSGAGMVFLGSLSAAGSLGGGGFITELMLQGVMLSSIVLGIGQTMKEMELSSQIWLERAFSSGDSILGLKAQWEVIWTGEYAGRAVSGVYRTSLILGLLSKVLQIGILGGSLSV